MRTPLRRPIFKESAGRYFVRTNSATTSCERFKNLWAR